MNENWETYSFRNGQKDGLDHILCWPQGHLLSHACHRQNVALHCHSPSNTGKCTADTQIEWTDLYDSLGLGCCMWSCTVTWDSVRKYCIWASSSFCMLNRWPQQEIPTEPTRQEADGQVSKETSSILTPSGWEAGRDLGFASPSCSEL